MSNDNDTADTRPEIHIRFDDFRVVEFEEALVDRLADKIFRDGYGFGGSSDLIKTAMGAAETRIGKRIAGMVDEIFTGEFQPSDKWGKAEGEPTTMQKLVRTSISDFMSTKVDSNGKTGGYRADTTRMEWYVRQAAGADAAARVRPLFETAAKAVKESLSDSVRGKMEIAVAIAVDEILAMAGEKPRKIPDSTERKAYEEKLDRAQQTITDLRSTLAQARGLPNAGGVQVIETADDDIAF